MKTVNTLLVDLAWRHDHDPLVSLGAAGLLAALLEVMPGSAALMPVDVRRSGTTATSIVRGIGRRVRMDDPEAVVGLGAYVWNDGLVRGTVAALRGAGFRGRIVVGGPQVTYAASPIDDYPGADVVVRGYAEQALPAIIAGGGRGLPGVQFAGEPGVPGPCEFCLAACPSPYLTGVLAVAPGQAIVRWETQRGCPFRCDYCQHRDPELRPDVQTVPFERLEAEMDLFCRAGVRELKVLDPVFNRGDRAILVLDALRRRAFSGRLSVQCRPELVSGSFVDACAGLDVVPEVGLQTIHPEEGRLVGRSVDVDRVARAFELLNDRGIRYAVTLIYGLPGQTVESFRQTVDFCVRHRVSEIRAFPLMLLKGTDLDRRREELGLRTGPGPMPTVVGSPTFDERDIATMADLARAVARRNRR